MVCIKTLKFGKIILKKGNKMLSNKRKLLQTSIGLFVIKYIRLIQ